MNGRTAIPLDGRSVTIIDITEGQGIPPHPCALVSARSGRAVLVVAGRSSETIADASRLAQKCKNAGALTKTEAMIVCQSEKADSWDDRHEWGLDD